MFYLHSLLWPLMRPDHLLQQVVKSTGSKLTMLLNGSQIATRYGVHTLPHLVVINPKGIVQQIQIGAGREEALKQKLLSLLKSSGL